MIGVITQPNYLPWVGYFERIHYSDVFVFLDNVQYEKRSWMSRNRIPSGDTFIWLTVPVKKTHLGTPVSDVKISYEQDWITKHLKTFQHVYGKCEFFHAVYSLLHSTLNNNYEYLSDLDIDLIEVICDYLDININIERASDNHWTSKRSKLLVDVCNKYDINHYYSSIGSKGYMDEEPELFNNIKVEYQNAKYKSMMSVVDLLFNRSKDVCKDIIIGGAKHG